ncbi:MULTISPECIES: ABC transporter ATP-binding protein [unclassified Mesorhizobium]|uniref:ABC transporter ATP-binding protein n=1 Tax=unclassified Mesorhizobium TaxID=325217 RepID=UPI000FDC368F|nr:MULTISPECIES: ABC transporter ATP-binding protein [unclassified Mesorhizobium]TGR48933.1 ABC transporter ATP-binding protein [bacterium M00.F.Ca.ET.199.01.1.1]TGU37972.1 ABC transporter ATP-binding protein [bacterium M00.F.Ca.ET.156.01.1.1]TGV88607.1 ABC transporter ATP-binding protein [Mesorhizobium sp. M00.F.Ca.ET.149.01.1.1]TGQ82483.1 ABC transporter ATP-binding protein [Mesorhizobium sp. M8A.F.Ca.ET.207.01.1.1]TGR30620.1 ABC transporter ATP-binding protein [Mesorhizobium sp. M8A.F.Ca.ET
MLLFSWFERRLDPFPAAEPVEPPKTLVAFCLHYTRGAWPYILIDAVLVAAIAIAEVWMFGFLGRIVDWLSGQNRETFLQTEGWKLAGMAFIVLFALPGTVWLHSLLNQQTLMGNYPMRIRWQVHRYLLKQSMSFYQDEFAGRIATKLMQTALAVRECVIKVIDVLNYVIVYFLGMLLIVGSADWRLAAPLGVWLVGYILLLRFFIPRLGKVGEEQANARSTMTGRVVDSYTNIQTVKLFSHSRREAAFAREGMMGFLDTVYRSMRLVTVLFGSLYILNALLLFSVTAISLWLWMGQAVTIGAVAVVIGLVLRMWGMSQWIMWEMSGLFENIGTVQDGIASISLPRLVEDRPDAREINVSKGDIRFEDIRFHYGKQKGVIENLSLAVKPGEKVGIVGRSGAGKSTLVNLLLRFYDLESGRILIDGQEIAGVKQDSLRAQIGMVTQDTSLLHRSVRENILYGRPDASDEMLVEAARRAEALDFISALSDHSGRKGFDAYVGDRGVKLSGGQRQRIAIARVMLKDAPILILDEATSALDSEAEAAIQENLYKLMQGKTVIAIAHRLSTIAAMDRLVVMDQGRVIEEGSHEELVAGGGLYAQLWQRQSGGFLFEDSPVGAANDSVANDIGAKGQAAE